MLSKTLIGDQGEQMRSCMIFSTEYHYLRNWETVVVFVVVVEKCCSCNFQCYCHLWLGLVVLHVADPDDVVVGGC